jgi:hypothetical protein
MFAKDDSSRIDITCFPQKTNISRSFKYKIIGDNSMGIIASGEPSSVRTL